MYTPKPILPVDIVHRLSTAFGPIRINCVTSKGLGSGGFKFDYHHKQITIGDWEIWMSLEGTYVNPLGPFKKILECRIRMRVFPACTETNLNRVGEAYSYTCNYKERFWGQYYGTDAQQLCDKLIERMCQIFDGSDNYIESEGNARFGDYRWSDYKYMNSWAIVPYLE